MNFKSRLVKLGRLAAVHGRAEQSLVLECAQVGTDGADGLPLGFHRGHPGVQLVHAGPEPTDEEIALANPYVGPSTLLILLGPSHVNPPDFPAA